MDIFAHALWTSAVSREANSVGKKDLSAQAGKKFHVNVAWTAFWGIFPDLFAFSIPFALRFYFIIFGGNFISSFLERPQMNGSVLPDGFSLAQNLYQYSHSLVIWLVVFVLVWIFYKTPRYELLGWALHILIDIPSHVLTFFPTPFLFPISNYHFPYGIPWSDKWFMIINYSLLLLVWVRYLVKDYLAKKANKI